jgi:hypothetical protein
LTGILLALAARMVGHDRDPVATLPWTRQRGVEVDVVRQVFLSYARIDGAKARRLSQDLGSTPGIRVWFDRVDLLPGMRWKPAIRKAIRESHYVVAMFSRQSVRRKGYRDTELAQALGILKEFPQDRIFLVPTRLDDCQPPRGEVEDLTYADLFPQWADGLLRLRASLTHRAGRRAQTVRPVAPARRRRGYEYEVGLVDLDEALPSLGSIARGLNGVQRFLHFRSSRASTAPKARRRMESFPQLDIDRLPLSFYGDVAPLEIDRVLCLSARLIMCDQGTHYNFLTATAPANERVRFVSHHDLQHFAGEAGVSFASAIALLLTGELVDYFLNVGYHDETRNCPMDFTADHSELVGALRAGRFCRPCSRKLDRNPALKAAVTAMLQWDRNGHRRLAVAR